MAGKPIFVLGSFVVACSAKVARFPRPGESLAAETVTIEPGGKGLNQAIMARRLGAAVDGLLAVGDDLAAAFAPPALERAELPLSMLVRLAGHTGSGIGFTDATGETCLAVASGANLALTAAHVKERGQAITEAALVTAQFEIGDAPIAAAFQLARQAGVPTLLNPSPYRAIPEAMLAQTSILIVNETEARGLAVALGLDRDGATEPQRFARELGPALLERGPRLVVLTRGAAGAFAVAADAPPAVQAGFPVETVDSLGAGDAFAMTLGVRLAMGLPLPVALRDAAAAGALTTTRHGVFDALPTAGAIAAISRS
ncbi:PfkB family carbohydrate kinase [Bosea sp. ANAM02]|uniref:PfkB family carbohydrate kinase n=1 Tax=Bosea sp. ANAM02 TaxID=2020412 RepID=UPI00140F1DE9|nr:PfkB family carbohydrate kinase [Bosea sp. ANAM02]BCB21074.1 ribokinase [Bosea sp. ANAM02]